MCSGKEGARREGKKGGKKGRRRGRRGGEGGEGGGRGGRRGGRRGQKRGRLDWIKEIEVEPEVQGSRNSDLQFKSKKLQRSCKHWLGLGSHLPLARNHL